MPASTVPRVRRALIAALLLASVVSTCGSDTKPHRTVAFLLSGLTWGTLLLAPPAFPIVVLLAVVGFVTFAVRRRWR